VDKLNLYIAKNLCGRLERRYSGKWEIRRKPATPALPSKNTVYCFPSMELNRLQPGFSIHGFLPGHIFHVKSVEAMGADMVSAIGVDDEGNLHNRLVSRTAPASDFRCVRPHDQAAAPAVAPGR